MSEKTLAKREITELSAENLISQAITANLPVDSLERLLAMRRELKAEYAKESYDRAMSAFQGECPIIRKTKAVHTNSGQLAYKYAPLDSIQEQVGPILERHGFSYATQTETGKESVKATIVAKHVDGHSEEYSFEAPLGGQTQIMSATQRVAAALTFCKRQAFLNSFGILTGDDDTDAVKQPEEADQQAVQDAIDSLLEAKTLEALKATYAGLGKLKLVRSVVIAKDARKKELS